MVIIHELLLVDYLRTIEQMVLLLFYITLNSVDLGQYETFNATCTVYEVASYACSQLNETCGFAIDSSI